VGVPQSGSSTGSAEMPDLSELMKMFGGANAQSQKRQASQTENRDSSLDIDIDDLTTDKTSDEIRILEAKLAAAKEKMRRRG